MNKESIINIFSERLLSHYNEEAVIMYLARSLGIEDEVRYKTKFYDFKLPGFKIESKATCWTGWKHKLTYPNTITKESSDQIKSHTYFFQQIGNDAIMTCYCGLSVNLRYADQYMSTEIRKDYISHAKYGSSNFIIGCEFTPDEAIAYLNVRDIIK